MKFTEEGEENGLLSPLDIKISRENNKCATPVYHTPTIRVIFTNLESFN